MKISNFENFEFWNPWLVRNPRQILQIWDDKKIDLFSQNHKKFARTTPSIKEVTVISRFDGFFPNVKKTQ